MSDPHSNFQLKLTVARFLELSYRENEGLTKRLVKSAGSLKLKVDEDGNGSLVGSIGTVNFSASDAIKDIGISLKGASIAFGSDRDGNLTYRASYTFPGISEGVSVIVTGAIDIDKLIMACSGLYCRAARAFGNRQAIADTEIRKAMGK